MARQQGHGRRKQKAIERSERAVMAVVKRCINNARNTEARLRLAVVLTDCDLLLLCKQNSRL